MISITQIKEKYQKLQEYLLRLDNLLVAFSGGVDSTFLLNAAHGVLGQRVLAVTVTSPFFPKWEQRQAKSFVDDHKIRYRAVDMDPLKNGELQKNPPNRCYLCKKDIFLKLQKIAAKSGISTIADGSNADDKNEYRPDLVAVIEMGVASPLRDAGLTKHEIRILAKEMGLEGYDKPSSACLATRFPCWEQITEEKLAKVEKAEETLWVLGFQGMRVRYHGNLARIELAEKDLERAVSPGIRRYLCTIFKEIGFRYISLDMQGYRKGSMDEGWADTTTG